MVKTRAEKEKTMTAKSIITRFFFVFIYKILSSRIAYTLTYNQLFVNGFVHMGPPLTALEKGLDYIKPL